MKMCCGYVGICQLYEKMWLYPMLLTQATTFHFIMLIIKKYDKMVAHARAQSTAVHKQTNKYFSIMLLFAFHRSLKKNLKIPGRALFGTWHSCQNVQIKFSLFSGFSEVFLSFITFKQMIFIIINEIAFN